jgi:hypothetical protein
MQKIIFCILNHNKIISMKKAIILILILVTKLYSFGQVKGIRIDGGDNSVPYHYPPTYVSDGITYWCGYPIDTFVKWGQIIFEGKILTDSVYFQNPPGMVETYHKVLVLKKFKGDLISDTIVIATSGGEMIINDERKGSYAFARKGDEAIIWAIKYGGRFPDIYFQCLGYGCGYLPVCNKKDIEKEVYEVIEKATGQPYVDVHPNTCASKPQK